MLETLSIDSHSGQVFRFANPRDDVAALRALGIDPDSVPDMLDLLSRRAAPGGIQRLVDGSFEHGTHLDHRMVPRLVSPMGDGRYATPP